MILRLIRRLVGTSPNDPSPDPEPSTWPVPREHLELLLDRLESGWDLQLKELEGLDSKITIVLGSTGVLLGLVVAALPYLQPNETAFGWGMAAIALLSVSMVVGIVALWPRTLKVAANTANLWSRYYAKSSEETIAVLGSTIVSAVKENGHIRKQKGWLMRGQMSALLLSLGALLLALLKAANVGPGLSLPPWW